MHMEKQIGVIRGLPSTEKYAYREQPLKAFREKQRARESINLNKIDEKLTEYKKRLTTVEKGLDNKKPSTLHLDTYYKIAVAEAYKQDGAVNKFDIVQKLSENDVPFDEDILNHALKIVEKYATTFKGDAETEEGPNIENKNVAKLRGKLEEYKARLTKAEENGAYLAPEMRAENDEEVLDARYKIAATEYFLNHGNMDEFAVADALHDQGIAINRARLLEVCAIIEDYAATGGTRNVGGTGLERNRQRGEIAPAQESGSDTLDKATLERAEAEALAQEREKSNKEWERMKKQDIIGETMDAALEQAQEAERTTAKKMGKTFQGFSNALSQMQDVLINVPLKIAKELGTYAKEGAENIAHDTSDVVLGTGVTDGIKRFWRNAFGVQNSEQRTSNERHQGITDIHSPTRMSGEGAFSTMWKEVSRIPGEIARGLDEWSPEALQRNTDIARGIEEAAWDVKNNALAEIEAEEKALRRRTDLSPEERDAASVALQERRDNADTAYADEVERGNVIKPTVLGAAARSLPWMIARGLPRILLSTGLDLASNYLGFGGIVAEQGRALADRSREKREKKSAQSETQDVIVAWAPQEQAMETLGELGDWIARTGEALTEARAEHAETILDEAKIAAQRELGVHQDAIAKRIGTLIEKTKITKEDQGEIAYLNEKLQHARKGLAFAGELDGAVQRAEALAKRAETGKDNIEQIVTKYFANKAINIIRGLDTFKGKHSQEIIEALQQHPDINTLRTAEAMVYLRVQEELKAAGNSFFTEDDQDKLFTAYNELGTAVTQATRVYESRLTVISAELANNLRAAKRDLTRAALVAEQAGDIAA